MSVVTTSFSENAAWQLDLLSSQQSETALYTDFSASEETVYVFSPLNRAFQNLSACLCTHWAVLAKDSESIGYVPPVCLCF